MTFTELNTVMPALIVQSGGGPVAVGALTAIMLGLPLAAQFLFAGFIQSRARKRPYLLLGIHLRIAALAAAALVVASPDLTPRLAIALVFATMAVFAASGSLAGLPYTHLVGSFVLGRRRRTFFVRRQVATSSGLLLSALVTRRILALLEYPTNYVVLFAAASSFLLIASFGFWMLPSEPVVDTPERSPKRVRVRDLPRIALDDGNLRALLTITNLAAPAFTALPLMTAMVMGAFSIDARYIGAMVLLQISGTLVANLLWSALIKRGGFRAVLGAYILVLVAVYALGFGVYRFSAAALIPFLYLLMGAAVGAQKIGIDSVLVQISPPDRLAIYGGIFGAGNVMMALSPLITGALLPFLGYSVLLLVLPLFALVALPAIGKLNCERTYV